MPSYGTGGDITTCVHYIYENFLVLDKILVNHYYRSINKPKLIHCLPTGFQASYKQPDCFTLISGLSLDWICLVDTFQFLY